MIDSNHLLSLIRDRKKLDDKQYIYLSSKAQSLKRELGLLKSVPGSHKSKNIRENKSRNPLSQHAELTECINEACENLSEGELSKDAWNRLSIKLMNWRKIPEYHSLVNEAENAIRKFEKYLETHK